MKINKMVQYNIHSQINNIDDVKNFFHHLYYDLNVIFHPDDMLEDYVSSDGVEFTPEKCEIYDNLMEKCHEVCEKEQVDIYGVGLDILENKIA